ncbi:hypothetical protein EV424DRAFT_1384483 [Suillus variegatus]|nr:hypothetical protein EV424DRAFT_1384483 [Suillus variegatus]
MQLRGRCATENKMVTSISERVLSPSTKKRKIKSQCLTPMHQTDMNRTTTQSEDNTLTVVNHAYMIRCGRCQTVIEYDTQTDWPTVSLLVHEHLDTCPAKLNFHEPATSHSPSETYDTQNAPSHNVIGKMGADDNKCDGQFIAGCHKQQRKSEGQRKQELEDDEYTYSVCPTSVRCRGCEKEISLDKRSRYYPGLWTKHREKCRGIRRIEEDKLNKSATREGVCPWSAERCSNAASSFKTENPWADGILRVASSVESNISRQMELSDDEELPEEGDRDIPFSTLNEQFYNECWQRGDDRPWAYRYSTTKEIEERTIGTVYFDTAVPKLKSPCPRLQNGVTSIQKTTSLGCSAKTQ